jgi:hypothetical protein
MNLRGIQSLAMLLWGFQSELLAFAVPMALIWEGRFFFNRRWALTKQDFYLLADLTSVCLVLMIIFLFMNRTDYHFIRTLMQWLPILLFPLIITVGYSTNERLTLDVLFYSLRRQKQPVTQSWDLDYLLFGFLLVSSGTSKDIGSFYFPIAALLIFLSLLPLRSPRHSKRIWMLVCSLVFVSAFVTHTGIRETHLELRKRAQVWLSNWIQQRTNPLKSQTSIGQIGRLKASNEILYRIAAPEGGVVPGLLQEAVYDLSSENSWSILKPQFVKQAHSDDFTWDLEIPTTTDIPLDIYHEFHRENDLVPLPPGTARIQDLPALDIQKNYYGTIQAQGMVPSPRYQVTYQPGQNHTGPPAPSDTVKSRAYSGVFSKISAQGVLDSDQPLLSLQRFFRDFRYSLYQPSTIISSPIEDFLLNRKAGHCEFFATATVLMLREMGIPARYATGYAIQEYDDMLGMFVVRQRHAHAWALAYLDGRWRAVDTTPGIWLETESAEETLLQPALDLFANLTFLFQIWWNDQKQEDYEPYLFGLGALLMLLLIWRISTSEQIVVSTKATKEDEEDDTLHRGNQSPLFTLEAKLLARGYSRRPGEVFANWLKRIGYHEFLALIPSHNRLRFHPKGLTESEAKELAANVDTSIQQLNSEDMDLKTKSSSKKD